MTNKECAAILRTKSLAYTDGETSRAVLEQAIQALEGIDHITAERDAAVSDMKTIFIEELDCRSVCRSCKHGNYDNASGPCTMDGWNDSDNTNYCGYHNEKWKWRGPCAENGGLDDGQAR